jgi:hypothetical protein
VTPGAAVTVAWRLPVRHDPVMATCNLCPPGSRDIPDDRMADHLRSAHPDVDTDGTRRSDGSTISGDASPAPADADAPDPDDRW